MNDNRVFMDTGAWLAISLSDDRYHALATQTLKKLLNSGFGLITSNHVIGETFHSFRYRLTDRCFFLNILRF